MFPTLALLLPAALGTGEAVAPAPTTTPPAAVVVVPERGPCMRLLRGRADVVDVLEVGRHRAPVERLVLEPEAHLELSALGELELAWSGRGSLTVEGPGGLQWTRGAFGQGGAVELFDFRAVDLEVRSGPLALELPGGVQVELRRGALQLEAGPAGRYLLHHLGGEPASLRGPAGASLGRTTLGPGDELWLDPVALLGGRTGPRVLPTVEQLAAPSATGAGQADGSSGPPTAPQLPAPGHPGEPAVDQPALDQPALDLPGPAQAPAEPAPPVGTEGPGPAERSNGPLTVHRLAGVQAEPVAWLPLPVPDEGRPVASVVRSTAVPGTAPGAAYEPEPDEPLGPVRVVLHAPSAPDTAPAGSWSPLPGDRRGPLEVHLQLHTAAGPCWPTPVALPQDPGLGPRYRTPEGFRPRVGEFSLEELLRGRVDR